MSWWKKLTNKARGVYGAPSPPPAPEGGCDHGAIHLRQGTAEFEWFVARGELEMNRDLKHGAGHLANLLTYDPGYPEWIELLEQYLAAAGPDPESLIPRGDKLYYSTEGMRAYIWHKQGRLADAIDLLVNVVQAKADSRYLEAWGLNWLEPPGAMESLPEQTGLLLLSSALNRFPEARLSPLPRLREMQRWAQLGERFARHHSTSGIGTMLRAGLLRKAGLLDEAEAVVRAALEDAPDWHSVTALGLILREKGDFEGAEKAFAQALELDPDDISARLEAGDTLFDRQLWERALKWYESALARERKQPWALPSAQFCRWKLTNDERPIRELVELAKKGNQRAQNLHYLEFWARLPEPVDATANLVRQFRQTIIDDPKNAPTGEAKLTLSSLEAPSNYLACRLEMEALGHDLRLAVATDRVPEPDPRQPIVPVKFLLWKYDGTTASPGLPPPAEDVVRRIADLAAAPFDEQANWAAASRVAEALGPGRVGEILAAMVHPPAVPKGSSGLTWLPLVQRASAQVAAQVDAGWEGSARQEALLSVLLGPRDWATEAAIRALARLGRENEAYAPDIHDAFQQLADARPNAGYWAWVRTLFSCWQELPHLYPQEREELERTVREIARAEAEEK
ncbi:MAG TPA: tetratricopeptide repeat protein [Gemmataceae bacterium]|nr:tetratricopeptide repeat protein [Gemmataceae bacterium]